MYGRDYFGNIWNAFALEDMIKEYETMLTGWDLDYQQLFQMLLQGRLLSCIRLLGDALGNYVVGTVSGYKALLFILLALGIFGASVAVLGQVFQNKQVGQLAFYIIYLLLMTILLQFFSSMADLTRQILFYEHHFLELFLPCFMGVLAISGGITSAVSYYQIFLCILFLLEKILLLVYIPMVYGYVLLALMNGVLMEESLKLLLIFYKKIMDYSLKIIMGTLTSVSILQSLIGPSIDAITSNTWQKACSMLPVLGNLSEGIVQLIMGSASLIKNALGVFVCILLFILCSVPLLQIGLKYIVFKLSGGLMNFVCDKRMAHLVDQMGEAMGMLLKAMFAGMLFIMITISIACFFVGTHR